MHGHHAHPPGRAGRFQIALHEHGEKVGLAVRVLVFGKGFQRGILALAAHIGWIGYHAVIGAGQQFRLPQQRFQGLGLGTAQLAARIPGIFQTAAQVGQGPAQAVRHAQ